jgi:DASS family divalent anion:Na+ symporter
MRMSKLNALCSPMHLTVPAAQIKSTPEAPKQAKEQLKKMGPMGRDEIITLLTMLGAVTMWVCGESIGVPPVQAAMMALCTLLVTGVLSWRDCLTYSPAWDTLLWWVA